MSVWSCLISLLHVHFDLCDWVLTLNVWSSGLFGSRKVLALCLYQHWEACDITTNRPGMTCHSNCAFISSLDLCITIWLIWPEITRALASQKKIYFYIIFYKFIFNCEQKLVLRFWYSTCYSIVRLRLGACLVIWHFCIPRVTQTFPSLDESIVL